VDTGKQDRLVGKEPSLHRLLKTRKCQATRLINQIHNGILHTSTASVLKVFTARFHSKYKRIQIDERSVRRIADCGEKTDTLETNTSLEEPISQEEIRHAVTHGKANKAPGQDGHCLEFFKKAWDVIKHNLPQTMNHMYIDDRASARQKQGLSACRRRHTPRTPTITDH